jgi:hypothetical protein
MNKRKQKTKSANAPGQYFGYSVQQTRLLHYLLAHRVNSATQAVSLEVLDDIATHGQNTITEQVKSGLAHNPLADHASDLWKTLFNWLNAIRSGAVEIENTQFILHVIQPHKGDVVQKINDVQDNQSARELIQELRHQFWGKPPEYKNKDHLSQGLKKFLSPVLSANEELLEQLFIQFSLETGTGDPIDPIRLQIAQLPVSSNSIDLILDQMLGWVKRKTDSLIAKKKPAIIACEEFSMQLLACVRETDRSVTALISTAPKVSDQEVATEIQKKIYIKQLKIIDLDSLMQEEAASDYLRAAADRTNWAMAGEVFEGHVLDFESRLIRSWNNKLRVITIEHKSKPEVTQGQLLYSTCCDLTDIRLHGMDVPSHFVPGSLHAMADSLKIGWHPNFITMLGHSYTSTSLKKKHSGKKSADKNITNLISQESVV